MVLTLADLEANQCGLTDGQIIQAEGLIAAATARIEAFTRRSFRQVVGDEIVLRSQGDTIQLPGQPVTAVVSVGALDPNTAASSDWVWDGISKIILADPAVSPTGTWRVTYDHGYTAATVPPVVKQVALAMVARILNAPTVAEGVVQESIGQYAVQMQQGSGAPGSVVRLYESDKRALIDAGLRRTARTFHT